MSNSRPYFVWTWDKLTKLDVTKAEYLYPNRTSCKVEDGNKWEVRAKMNQGETRTDEDYLLGYAETLEGARSYIDKLTASITSNMRDTDGSPLIIETVSPEAFRGLKQEVYKLVAIVKDRSDRLDGIDELDRVLALKVDALQTIAESRDSRQLVDKEQFNDALKSVMDVLEYLLKPDDDGGEEHMVKGGKREANTAWRYVRDVL